MKRLIPLVLLLAACGDSPAEPYTGPLRLTVDIQTTREADYCHHTVRIAGDGVGSVTWTGASLAWHRGADVAEHELDGAWAASWVGVPSITADHSAQTWIDSFPDSLLLTLAYVRDGGEADDTTVTFRCH